MKNKKLSKLEQEYNAQANIRKDKIRQETSKFKRFWKWIWYFISFPFVWLFYNIRDWRSAICVVIAFLLWSVSVWGFYLAAIICGWSTPAAKWLIAIGSAVWGWWLSPAGSPFILIVTMTSIGLKAIWNKIRNFRNEKE